MIVDAHGHTMAPPELYAFQAMLAASRGHHGHQPLRVSDDRLETELIPHIGLLRHAGIDVQFISPRPFTMMHSQEPPKIVRWYVEAVNDLIARQVALHPDVFRGVAGLPQSPSLPIESCLDELERCVDELGFVGCLLNPDPTEGKGMPPTLGGPYWYPLYAKLVELDVPALIHSAGCQNPRESYSSHFITEESIAVLSLTESAVFDEFPTLKLVVSHGGGSVPYQVGRWRAHYWRTHGVSFDEALRRLHFDTVLYNRESLELLFRVVGTDRCLFGTEKPGSGSAEDPQTGRWFDDLRPVIEGIEWLSAEDRQLLFEDNARRLYTRFREPATIG
jgi:predicted TIM-barrel fold metal-dependent hydrolase